jgi:hypothetical protein
MAGDLIWNQHLKLVGKSLQKYRILFATVSSIENFGILEDVLSVFSRFL